MSTACGPESGSTFAPFPSLWGFSVFRTSSLHREWLTTDLITVTAEPDSALRSGAGSPHP